MTQHPAGIDYNKLSVLVNERLPKNLDAEDIARWKKGIQDKIIQEYQSVGRIKELMLDSVTESDTIAAESMKNDESNMMSEIEDRSIISDFEEKEQDSFVSQNNSAMYEAADYPAAKKKENIRRQFPTAADKKSTSKPVRDEETIQHIPKAQIAAMRQIFPGSANKIDMFSAMVYIISDGACEISESAMQFVKAYKKDDMTVTVVERLGNLERMIREQGQMLQAVELCTCYNTYDRRYGAKERRKSPKDTEFREKDNLDMLARLRQQAKDRRQVDNLERGHDIYYQTKK